MDRYAEVIVSGGGPHDGNLNVIFSSSFFSFSFTETDKGIFTECIRFESRVVCHHCLVLLDRNETVSDAVKEEIVETSFFIPDFV